MSSLTVIKLFCDERRYFIGVLIPNDVNLLDSRSDCFCYGKIALVSRKTGDLAGPKTDAHALEQRNGSSPCWKLVLDRLVSSK
jgi:hypothetical protein